MGLTTSISVTPEWNSDRLFDTDNLWKKLSTQEHRFLEEPLRTLTVERSFLKKKHILRHEFCVQAFDKKVTIDSDDDEEDESDDDQEKEEEEEEEEEKTPELLLHVVCQYKPSSSLVQRWNPGKIEMIFERIDRTTRYRYFGHEAEPSLHPTAFREAMEAFAILVSQDNNNPLHSPSQNPRDRQWISVSARERLHLFSRLKKCIIPSVLFKQSTALKIGEDTFLLYESEDKKDTCKLIIKHQGHILHVTGRIHEFDSWRLETIEPERSMLLFQVERVIEMLETEFPSAQVVSPIVTAVCGPPLSSCK